MITNIPTASDYQKLAGECLNQAFDLIYAIDKDRDLLEDQDVSMQEVWHHNQGTLRTSVVLVHQGIEAFMKAAVCSISPLLLIDDRRNDWPTLPNSPSVDFGNLFTSGAASLVHTYGAVAQQKLTTDLISFIDDVRRRRNAIVHGIPAGELSPIVIVEMVLNGFTFFVGKDAWWDTMREQYINDPLFGMMDSDYEIAAFGERLDYVEALLGKGKLSKHLTQNLRSRRYFCPSCKSRIEDQGGSMDSKWAYLRPNEPNSSNIVCLGCQQSFQVVREDCTSEYCHGNVVYENEDDTSICLTCGEEQE